MSDEMLGWLAMWLVLVIATAVSLGIFLFVRLVWMALFDNGKGNK